MPIRMKKDQTAVGWQRQSRRHSNIFRGLEEQRFKNEPSCLLFGTEASACRDALDLAEYTRAMLHELLIGEKVLPDEWREEHSLIRVITDCKSLFDCLAKDASVPEDGGTALLDAS